MGLRITNQWESGSGLISVIHESRVDILALLVKVDNILTVCSRPIAAGRAQSGNPLPYPAFLASEGRRGGVRPQYILKLVKQAQSIVIFQ